MSGPNPDPGVIVEDARAATEEAGTPPSVARGRRPAVTFDRRGAPLHALRGVSLEVRAGEIWASLASQAPARPCWG